MNAFVKNLFELAPVKNATVFQRTGSIKHNLDDFDVIAKSGGTLNLEQIISLTLYLSNTEANIKKYIKVVLRNEQTKKYVQIETTLNQLYIDQDLAFYWEHDKLPNRLILKTASEEDEAISDICWKSF